MYVCVETGSLADIKELIDRACPVPAVSLLVVWNMKKGEGDLFIYMNTKIELLELDAIYGSQNDHSVIVHQHRFRCMYQNSRDGPRIRV